MLCSVFSDFQILFCLFLCLSISTYSGAPLSPDQTLQARDFRVRLLNPITPSNSTTAAVRRSVHTDVRWHQIGKQKNWRKLDGENINITDSCVCSLHFIFIARPNPKLYTWCDCDIVTTIPSIAVRPSIGSASKRFNIPWKFFRHPETPSF